MLSLSLILFDMVLLYPYCFWTKESTVLFGSSRKTQILFLFWRLVYLYVRRQKKLKNCLKCVRKVYVTILTCTRVCSNFSGTCRKTSLHRYIIQYRIHIHLVFCIYTNFHICILIFNTIYYLKNIDVTFRYFGSKWDFFLSNTL